jgi:hypothetical protein
MVHHGSRGMKRLLSLLMAGLLVACATPGVQPDSGQASHLGADKTAVIASAALCRTGPDGGAVVADRGIGGTGSPLVVHAAAQITDHGIGDTGIVGVITGFASICVNGIEVHYDDTVTVDVDGTAATIATLRAGQMVVIQADGSRPAAYARTISVRNELIGQIQSVMPGSATLTVAGQPVSVPVGIPGADRFGPGDWVSVSGLRREDGVVVASRLATAAAGRWMVRGVVVRQGDVIRVGSLVLPEAVAGGVQAGQFVTVSGGEVGGQGQVDAVVLGTSFADPAAYFDRSVNQIVVQAFVRVTNDRIWLNGAKIAAAPGVRQQARPGGIAIVSLQRQPAGSFAAVGLRFVE